MVRNALLMLPYNGAHDIDGSQEVFRHIMSDRSYPTGSHGGADSANDPVTLRSAHQRVRITMVQTCQTASRALSVWACTIDPEAFNDG